MIEKGIPPQSTGLGFLWIWTIGWCGLRFPIAWIAWTQQPVQWGMRLFISCFVVIGLVALYVKQGADANIRHTADTNKHGDTALLVAFYKGHLDIAQLLLEHGAQLKAKNRWDWGALHMAAQGHCIACMQWLLSRGFSPNEPAPTSRGETPVMLAAGRNQLTSLQWLTEHGGSLTQKDPYDYNALGWAEFFNKQDTAQWIRSLNISVSK